MTQRPGAGATMAFITVTSLFFAWGFITSLIDPLVAAVKSIFQLSDVMAQLSASAFFIAYGLVSVPAAGLVARRRATSSIVVALAMMTVGCLVMLAAANLAVYSLVLLGLFILASGITILQVAANPLAASLGPPERSHFRLTLSQTFNSLGTFIGPYVGSLLFLNGLEIKPAGGGSHIARANALVGIDRAYLWLGGLILIMIVLFLASRRTIEAAAPPSDHSRVLRAALGSKWAVFGAAAIFLYVGAEVSIGTMLTLFLHSDPIWGAHDAPRAIPALAAFMRLDGTAGVSLQEAAKAVSLYWGGAMVGRFVGSGLLMRIRAGYLLATATLIAAGLCLFVVAVGGAPGGFVALAIGLFNSIMFPTIFSISLERSTAGAEATSGLLCTAIVGGALIPPITGLVSQVAGYATAFSVPLLCYAGLCVFALAACRGRTVEPNKSDLPAFH